MFFFCTFSQTLYTTDKGLKVCLTLTPPPAEAQAYTHTLIKNFKQYRRCRVRYGQQFALQHGLLYHASDDLIKLLLAWIRFIKYNGIKLLRTHGHNKVHEFLLISD